MIYKCDAPRVHLVCEMEQFHYEALYAYLSKGEYPSYYDANKKRILRRKAENFRIDNGELFYVGKKKRDKSEIY